ncbi:hypothetical protein ACFWMR_23985 [Amycolatopsis thailandensis]|uniref:hypothetical protein n=1 Tax=Amycolatopsis thailandensis TaxID=589330 RepID=UPI003668051F
MVFHDLTVILSLFGGAGAATGFTAWMTRRHGGRTNLRTVGVWDVLKAWVEGKNRATMERERRVTRLETIKLIATMSPPSQVLSPQVDTMTTLTQEKAHEPISPTAEQINHRSNR